MPVGTAMPRYVLGASEDPDTGVVVPGIYASLLPWAEKEYAKSGDPRWRYCHDDGQGGMCRRGPGCGHGDPPPKPQSSQGRMLEALKAGQSVVVSNWVASGHRWLGTKWSEPQFALPWDRRAVRNVRVSPEDQVSPA